MIALRLSTGNEPPPQRGGTAGAGAAQGLPLATRILIIEDEAMIAWTLESYLEDLGFSDIEIAADGIGAIAAAAARRPGLIVSDINLGGGLDGVAAVVAIRAADPMPILFVSGYAGGETRSRIDREVPGAVVLRKPLQSEDLHGAVVRILSGARPQ